MSEVFPEAELDVLPVPFAELAARAPKHDPAACTRQPCRRCNPSAPARGPKQVKHHVAPYEDRTLSPFDPLVPLLRRYAPEVSDKLATHMVDLADAIGDHGHDRWARLVAWEHHAIGLSLTHEEPGDDDRPDQPRAVSLDEERLRGEEVRAGRYADDTRRVAADLPVALQALPSSERHVKGLVNRLRFLLAVAETRKPRQLKSREQTATQVAADGWCRSCYRVGIFEPISTRVTGEPYYVDLCRWCGSHKGELPQPPVDLLRVHHRIDPRK